MEDWLCSLAYDIWGVGVVGSAMGTRKAVQRVEAFHPRWQPQLNLASLSWRVEASGLSGLSVPVGFTLGFTKIGSSLGKFLYKPHQPVPSAT